jgi:hypothetical protein
MTGRPVTGRPVVADARRRARNAVRLVLLLGLVPLAISTSIARAWVFPTLIVLAFAGIAAGGVAWLADAGDVPPPDGTAAPSYQSPPVHHERIARVRRSLVQATKEPASFDRHVRPVLAELADDRLRATFGISITTHPDAARARLGEELWQRLTTDSVQPLTEAELRRLVSTVDRLSPPS